MVATSERETARAARRRARDGEMVATADCSDGEADGGDGEMVAAEERRDVMEKAKSKEENMVKEMAVAEYGDVIAGIKGSQLNQVVNLVTEESELELM
ncbi:hypothetical protein Scep_024423 [Stephania cephalantha]|uniref:Uncharacterized protein n=1 Tax=Stephania cephalantha TaxID=152367 RepID=A0AAP0HTN7_9MAGN